MNYSASRHFSRHRPQFTIRVYVPNSWTASFGVGWRIWWPIVCACKANLFTKHMNSGSRRETTKLEAQQKSLQMTHDPKSTASNATRTQFLLTNKSPKSPGWCEKTTAPSKFIRLVVDFCCCCGAFFNCHHSAVRIFLLNRLFDAIGWSVVFLCISNLVHGTSKWSNDNDTKDNLNVWSVCRC